jgi:AraC family transcriptional regulator
MAVRLRASSGGRSWTGFGAKIYDTSGGRSAPPPSVNHCVIMHVGTPIHAYCRCDGVVQQRRQTVPGDIDVIPRTSSAVWEEDGPTTVLGIHVTPLLVRIAAQDMGLDPDRVAIAPQLQLRDSGLEHIAWALKAELEAPDPHGRLYTDSLGIALAAGLLRRYAPLAPRELGGNYSKRRLREVIDYIHDNLAQDLSLAELADVAGLSTSHFNALFKHATALPVHQYVIQCRVERAMNLLLHGMINLSEVASLAGFSDQSHMARCMRRLTGVTPALVRRHQR